MDSSKSAVWLIDGFNLYHSLRLAEPQVGDVRWLNLWTLAEEHGHAVGAREVAAVHFFTAPPFEAAGGDPGRLARHQAYIRALTAWRPSTKVHLGHFQRQSTQEEPSWQEKGTDVALAMTAMELGMSGIGETLVVVSGDSDFLPMANVFRRRFPSVRLAFAFPHARVSRRLRQAVPDSFVLGAESYRRNQLPDAVSLPSGRTVHRPKEWR